MGGAENAGQDIKEEADVDNDFQSGDEDEIGDLVNGTVRFDVIVNGDGDGKPAVRICESIDDGSSRDLLNSSGSSSTMSLFIDPSIPETGQIRSLPSPLGSSWNMMVGQFKKDIMRESTDGSVERQIDIVGFCNELTLEEEDDDDDEDDDDEDEEAGIDVGAGPTITNEKSNSTSKISGPSLTTTPPKLTAESPKHSTLKMYTIQRLDECKSLRTHPMVVGAIEEMWFIEDLQRALDEDGCLSRDPYVNLLVKFQFLIVPPPLLLSKAIRNAEIDWVNDVKGASKMNKSMFEDAMFQIADTWSVNTDVGEYCSILRTLLDGVTSVASDLNPISEEQHHSGNSPAKNPGLSGSQSYKKTTDGAMKARSLRELIRNNKLIKYNPVFGTIADRKFEGFQNILAQVYKKKHIKHKLTRTAAYQAVGKIYQAKLENDEKCKKKGTPLSRFDKFIFEQFVVQYGSKKLAKRNLKRFFFTVRQLAEKGDHVMYMFAFLSGIEVTPLEDLVLVSEYDPFFVSDYYLPILCRIISDSKQVGNTIAQCRKSMEVFSTLGITLQVVVGDICRRTPASSFTLHDFFQAVRRCSIKVSDGQRSSLTFGNKNQAKRLQMSRYLSNALGEKGVIGGVTQNLMIDVNAGLVYAIPAWQADRKWATIFQFVLSAKAVTKWVRFCRARRAEKLAETESESILSNSTSIPRSLSVLSLVQIESKRISRTSFASVAALNSATEMIEIMSGQNLREAITLTKKESFLSLFGSGEQEDESDAAQSNDSTPLFTVSPRTPRKVLEEARQRDQILNSEARDEAQQEMVIDGE